LVGARLLGAPGTREREESGEGDGGEYAGARHRDLRFRYAERRGICLEMLPQMRTGDGVSDPDLTRRGI
jgi:hypothetical protein